MALLVAELVTPERLMFSGEVRSVLLPAAEGDMTVLPGHVPVVTALLAGIVFATDATGTGRRAFVSGGFAEVTGERVTILAERVTPMEELNGDRLDQEIAELRLEQDSTADYARRARCDAAIRRLEEVKASLGV
ncbi:ATP synthase F1 subunit epsilon [Methylobacterium nonmethylotrophicum]|uniref:ATP synthase epsilon chain n=1 Tax=Methylobacterium nonmethylotrophicum TaxID=1141884 RepID=A0A4Z0NRJ1_9HYPH|nr:ATP synthase F1 subunit epsilon [Methylobacterium nonmethylotrophicum]TGD98906.1 ATP synthase F1 subunit epsilon [Methylobacterium nonmethylotrophicum]